MADVQPWRERAWRALAAPFENVEVRVEHVIGMAEDVCLLEYRGAEADLLASGAMSAAGMATPQRGHARWDEDGHHVRLWNRLSRKRLEFHRRVPFAKALSLPGVSRHDLEDVRDDRLRRTGRSNLISAADSLPINKQRPFLRLVVGNRPKIRVEP